MPVPPKGRIKCIKSLRHWIYHLSYHGPSHMLLPPTVPVARVCNYLNCPQDASRHCLTTLLIHLRRRWAGRLARGLPFPLLHNVLVYVGNVRVRPVYVPPRYIYVLTMLFRREPLNASLRRFPFGSLCSLATGTDLGSGPSKERHRGNYDHGPFAKAVEELSPILLISCGHLV